MSTSARIGRVWEDKCRSCATGGIRISRTNQPPLDKTNIRILERLCRDGRLAYSAMAAEMKCSVNTIRDRIMAMERRGVIRAYRAVVDPKRLGLSVRALVLVQQDPYHDGKELDPATVPGCLEAHRSTGTHSLALELVAPTLEALHGAIHDHIYPHGYMQARIVPLNGKITAKGQKSSTEVPVEAPVLEAAAPASTTADVREVTV